MTVTTRTARLVALAAAASAGLALGVVAGPVEAQATKAPSGAKKVYRWVDEKGQVHYGKLVLRIANADISIVVHPAHKAKPMHRSFRESYFICKKWDVVTGDLVERAGAGKAI